MNVIENNLSENSPEKMIMKEFEKLIEAAKKEYPDLSDQMEVFAACEAEMQSFRAYLDLMNETPAVVTSNSAK